MAKRKTVRSQVNTENVVPIPSSQGNLRQREMFIDQGSPENRKGMQIAKAIQNVGGAIGDTVNPLAETKLEEQKQNYIATIAEIESAGYTKKDYIQWQGYESLMPATRLLIADHFAEEALRDLKLKVQADTDKDASILIDPRNVDNYGQSKLFKTLNEYRPKTLAEIEQTDDYNVHYHSSLLRKFNEYEDEVRGVSANAVRDNNKLLTIESYKGLMTKGIVEFGQTKNSDGTPVSMAQVWNNFQTLEDAYLANGKPLTPTELKNEMFDFLKKQVELGVIGAEFLDVRNIPKTYVTPDLKTLYPIALLEADKEIVRQAGVLEAEQELAYNKELPNILKIYYNGSAEDIKAARDKYDPELPNGEPNPNANSNLYEAYDKVYQKKILPVTDAISYTQTLRDLTLASITNDATILGGAEGATVDEKLMEEYILEKLPSGGEKLVPMVDTLLQSKLNVKEFTSYKNMMNLIKEKKGQKAYKMIEAKQDTDALNALADIENNLINELLVDFVSQNGRMPYHSEMKGLTENVIGTYDDFIKTSKYGGNDPQFTSEKQIKLNDVGKRIKETKASLDKTTDERSRKIFTDKLLELYEEQNELINQPDSINEEKKNPLDKNK